MKALAPLRVLGLATAAFALAATAPAQPPTWWGATITPSASTAAADFAAANLGQAKNLAATALQDAGHRSMRLLAPGALPTLGWTVAPSAAAADFSVLNLGQLRVLSGPFLSGLATLGHPLPPGLGFPWNANSAGNFTAANLGQVKQAFSFSVYGAPRHPNVHPVITEVRSSGPVADQLEITNFSGNTIALGDYYLSKESDFRNQRDDRESLDGYEINPLPFPLAGTLGPGARTVVTMSTAAGYFTLGAGGDPLVLYRKVGPHDYQVVQEFVRTLPNLSSGAIDASLALNDTPNTPGYLTDWYFKFQSQTNGFGAANGQGTAAGTIREPIPPTIQVVSGGDAKVRRAGRGLVASTSAVQVRLRHPLEAQPGFEFRYTLDHSIPTAASATASASLTITLPGTAATHTTIKAIALRTLPTGPTHRVISPWTASTFVAVDKVADQRRPSAPAYLTTVRKVTADSGAPPFPEVDADYDMDPNLQTVRADARPVVEAGLRGEFIRGTDGTAASVPSIFLSVAPTQLFSNNPSTATADRALFKWEAVKHIVGEDVFWETVNRTVDASFEWYDPMRPESAFASQVRAEVTGDSSAEWDIIRKKSMKLRFGRGKDQGLYCDLFGEGKPSYVCSLALKHPAHDSWAVKEYGVPGGWRFRESASHISDWMVAQTMRDMGLSQNPILQSTEPRAIQGRSRLCHLYINGLYWGAYVLHERPDESFIATAQGTEVHQYTTISDNTPPPWGAPNPWDPYPHTPGNTHADHYMDYYMAAVFLGVADWPGNNIRLAGPKVVTSDRKWHFYGWGMELLTLRPRPTFSDGPHPYPTTHPYHFPISLHYVHDFDPSLRWLGCEMFMAYRHTSPFRERFLARMAAHRTSGGALSQAALLARYNRLAETFAFVAMAESARWGDSFPVTEWRLVDEENGIWDHVPTETQYAFGPISTDPATAGRLYEVFNEARGFLQIRPPWVQNVDFPSHLTP